MQFEKRRLNQRPLKGLCFFINQRKHGARNNRGGKNLNNDHNISRKMIQYWEVRPDTIATSGTLKLSNKSNYGWGVWNCRRRSNYSGLLQLFTRSTKDCTSILHFYMEAKRSLISATEGMVSLGYTFATSCAKLSYLSRNSFCQI